MNRFCVKMFRHQGHMVVSLRLALSEIEMKMVVLGVAFEIS